ncbi:pyrroline-5-carboxylate reductase [Lederbergia galactosidilyticus]|uniref:pyrroline-5-carboxylate reductase n=1 Tax=Lederbergia galactosidilytica TaxID=217031 RepID=UPI001AEAF6C1|nr:pyrroline-5-carboxylate reductase [Lederbergia galactosidilytica]MBP1914710.1 pyrroline-5-carboxylate reductase [Lederbergia galactosidilytica]
MKIAFIGAGSMAEAILKGILNKEACSPQNLWVTNRQAQARLESLREQYAVQITYDLQALLHNADMVILAVKPKNAEEILQQLSPYLTKQMFIVSVMAGISIESISTNLKNDYAVARVMPNTSASVGKSATAITFNEFVSQEQQQLAQTIFKAIGSTVIVEENKLDAITALSGSGPAYFYYIVEAMEKAAEQLGIEKDMARQLIIQTMNGAIHMLQETGKEAAELRDNVTSPGGTTEAGLKVLQEQEVAKTFANCILAAEKQSKKLAALFHEQIK